MSQLEVHDLQVRYGPVVAVDGVSLAVRAGCATVVLGANGAGKSSTLRAIAGLEPAASGSVTWAGEDITRARSHRIAAMGVVLVPEGRRIFSPLTVEENLLIGAYLEDSARRREERMQEVFEMFPILAERRSGASGLLSGGEQQMLAFGRALMSQPRMMLMDEPSMGLAPAVIDVVMQAVVDIRALGIGVLMVEQNAAVALEVADDAVVIERGSVVLAGTAAEMRDEPRVTEAFLGSAVDEVRGRP